MNNSVYILQSCNLWKEHSSCSILGVYDDEEMLKQYICDMFKNDEIKWNGVSIGSIEEDIRLDFEELISDDEDCNEDGYDEDSDVEALNFKKYLLENLGSEVQKVLDDIMSSAIYDIDRRSTYIVVSEYTLNEVY